MLIDNKLLKVAQKDWINANENHQPLDPLCTNLDLDKKTELFQEKLIELLNTHAKITHITSYSKRYWNKKSLKLD